MQTSPVLAAHRDRVIEQLSAGFAVDRIEVEDFEQRVALAHAAETTTALEALVTDLAPTASQALVPVRQTRVVFGSVERVGVWDVPARMAVRVLCGSLVLDLREAALGALTEIELHVTMGSVEVLVPPGVEVDLDASPVLGNVEDRSQPEAPTRRVRILGRVTLGNVEVETRLPREGRREARRRRRHERRDRRRSMHWWGRGAW